MNLPPKPQSSPPPTSPGFESETSGAAGQGKRPWTPPRCRRLGLGVTDGSGKPIPFTTELTPLSTAAPS
jgi:hypothetical protein